MAHGTHSFANVFEFTHNGQAESLLVSRVIQPELPTDPIELVEIEAVFAKAVAVIGWRELQNDGVWRQG